MEIKGMWTDGKPNSQPEGTTRINKNIVVTDKFGTISNEKGFQLLQHLDLTPIGIILLDKNDFVVFSTNGLTSEIGLVSQDKYILITRNPEFRFNLDKPIHGKFFINNNKERIITWTDAFNNLRSINVDNYSQSVAQTNAFNYYKIPILYTSIISGGQLQTGSYIPILQYISYDGALTNWIKKYNPIYIYQDGANKPYTQIDGNVPKLVTDKSIVIALDNLDTNYKKIRLGFIYQSSDVKEVFICKDISLDTFSQGSYSISPITITGGETLTQIKLEDIVIDYANYRAIDHITSIDKKLYGLGVSYNKEPDISTWVNQINLNWYSQPVKQIDTSSPVITTTTTVLNGRGNYTPPVETTYLGGLSQNTGYKLHEYNNKKKSFAHDEVYCFYIRVKWQWGYGKWNHIQGRTLTNDEKAKDGEFKVYQTRDTCTLLSKTSTSAIGIFSGWENEIDGIRHFKFPSHNWMKKNVWTDGDYGSKYLDCLGVKISNFNLSNFIDLDGNIAEGIEIGYAERTQSRVVGQSLFVPSVSASIDFVNGNPNKDLVSTGGTWKLGGTRLVSRPRAGLSLIQTTTITDNNISPFIRVYPYELLREKSQKNINYVRNEYLVNGNAFYYRDEDTHAKTIISDFTSNTTSPTSGTLVKVNEQRYIPANTITDTYKNIYLEEFIALEFDASNPFGVVGPFIDLSTANLSGLLIDFNCLLTLLNIERNYYTDYKNQQIVNTDFQGDIIFGGDTFIVDSSFNTYGVEYNLYTSDLSLFTKDNNKDTYNYLANGIRAVKRYLCESKYNMNLRYINPAFELQTSYYPKASDASAQKGYLSKLTKDVNPNDFVNGYDVDFNSLSDNEFSDILDPSKPFIAYDPFKIISSERLNNDLEVDVNAWRDFKINNFYNAERTKGRPVNFVGGDDFLYIHFQNSLYKTKPKGRLQSVEGIPIQLGYGEIFEFDPIEVIHSDLGELGTQHKWSCLYTNKGYVFFDNQKGIWFIVGSSVEILSNKGLYNFFKSNKDSLLDNPFVNMGIFTSYDEFYNRLIITKKNKKLKSQFVKSFKGVWTEQLEKTLVTGDIVLKNGIYQKVL